MTIPLLQGCTAIMMKKKGLQGQGKIFIRQLGMVRKKERHTVGSNVLSPGPRG